MLPTHSAKQKKILLVAVNASYIHSNPAVYALRRSAYAYAESKRLAHKDGSSAFPQIDIAEYTINDRYEDILFDLIGREADVIGMSVYIWNAQICLSLLADLRRLHPAGKLLLFAGGPEAATHPEAYLDSCDFVLTGEGEYAFSQLCAMLAGSFDIFNPEDSTSFTQTIIPDSKTLTNSLPGAVFLKEGTLQYSSAKTPVPQMDTLPFLYDGTEDFENRIIYYESSRGCPFRCSYCLSSLDSPVRFRNLETVKKELQFFLDRNVSLVKFVDRTFNANASRARDIWTFIKEHDNNKTCFHFEIGADLLRDEDLALLQSLRPGLIQLEIGIQSANPETLAAIRRTADNEKIFHAVRTLAKPQNIALHTDLIAGLPYEDLASFSASFNLVYALRAHQFQLGFLKVLAGTEMQRKESEYGLISSSRPPYTVMATKWLTAAEIDRLRGIADMVEIFWNSGLFRHALPYLEKRFDSAFAMYEELLSYYRRKLGKKSLSPRARGEFLAAFGRETHSAEAQKLQTLNTLETPSAQDIFETRKTCAAPNSNENFSLEVFEELLRFDNCLHFHASRRMSAEETFHAPALAYAGILSDTDFLSDTDILPDADLPVCPQDRKTEKTRSIRIRFDYTHTHPVTREATFIPVTF